MTIPAVMGHVDNLQFNQSISLDQLFTNLSEDVTSFDIRIRTTGGGHLVDPNGKIYTSSDGIISNALTTKAQLGNWHFVASSSAGLDLIGFDAITPSNSSNVASAVLTGTNLIKGIDYPFFISASNALAIKNGGYGFVVRYYSADGSETSLSSAEKNFLQGANLQIATVWENKFSQQQSGINAFAGTAGTTDANGAITQAIAAGQDAGSAIYFAVDVAGSNLSTLENYFNEIRTVFNSSTNGTMHYKVGIYAFDSGVYTDPQILKNIDFIWVSHTPTASTNWSIDQIETTDSTTVPKSTLDPYNRITVPGTVDGNGNEFGVDINVAKNGSFGAFGGSSQPGVTFVASPQSGPEGVTLTFRISVQNQNYALTPDYLIYYDTSNGTATAGSDYIGIANKVAVHFTASSPQYVDVTVQTLTDNNPNEGSETFNLNIYDNSQQLLNTAQGTITDVATSSPVISIAALDASKAEGSSGGTTPFTFTITRTGSTAGTNTVQWQVAFPDNNPNDATGSDFVGGSFPNGLVTFNPGDTTSKTITVNVVADSVPEASEPFAVVLSSPSGGATLGTGTANGLIINDDSSATAPTVNQITVAIPAPSNGNLNAGKTVSFTLQISEPVTVNTAGGVPRLTLNDNEVATYTGGSGTSALAFVYTVLAGDNIGDLQETGIVIPSGSTIKDSSSLALTDVFTVDTQLVIDTSSPTVSKDTPLSTHAGATQIITSSVLDAMDNFGSATQLFYTVTSGPSNGTLLLIGAATDSFTQDDINNSRVSYHETISGATSDTFLFKVSDAAGNSTGTAPFQINIFSRAPTSDFDGNSHSDILWHNDSGADSIWDNGAITGAHIIAAAGIVPASWHIAGTGDFDGNRHGDILWRNDDGSVSIWDDGAIGSAHIVSGPGVVPNSWHISGTGDFDGNGHDDILWRNDDGSVSIWDNGAIGSAHIISGPGVVANSWHIAGTGDFDGNGQSDILWRNDNGAVSIWDNGDINQAHIIAGAGVIPSGWSIAGTGDFDGNGHSDILWQRNDGTVAIWDNGQIGGAHWITNPGVVPAGWNIAGTGDFDGNGHSDILWHNDNGAASIWDNSDINRAHIIANAGAIPAGWHIV